MLIPLYGFLEGDTLGLLVLAQDQDTLSKVVLDLMQAAAVRVHPFEDPKIYFYDKLLDSAATVAQAGLLPLDRIDVRRGVQGCTSVASAGAAKDPSWHSTP